MKQVSLKKVVFVLAIALIISVIFNLHYYVNLRIKNENVLHTIRARALWTYGAEAYMIVHHFGEYLQTLNNDTYQEAQWAIYRLTVAGDALTQGVNEESGTMYYELKRTADRMEWCFVHDPSGRMNTTKIDLTLEPLNQISQAVTGPFDHLKNKDPIAHLEDSRAGGVDEVINYCRQIQEIVCSA